MPDRKDLIKELIKRSISKKDSVLGSRMIEIAGRVEKLDSYRLPIDDLRYNIKNGRFKAELLDKEKELCRQLDPMIKDDAIVIAQLLLDQEAEKTESLRKDIEKHGQLEPGLITSDGFVINGNKRMAILESLRADIGSQKYDYMEVMVLPEETNKKDLWRIEAGLQLSDEKRISYGPINELLKIREGKEIGLTDKQIADSIYGLKTDDIKERLEWLQLAEEYLKYIGQKESYKEIEAHFEHIKSLNAARKKLDKQTNNAREKSEFLCIGFEAIQHSATNSEIRTIGRAKTNNRQRAFSLLRNAYKDKTLTKEIVEDAVGLFKDEEDTQRPQKLVTKIVELLAMVYEVEDDSLVKQVKIEDLDKAKDLLGKIVYRRTKASSEKKQNIEKLKEKYRAKPNGTSDT